MLVNFFGHIASIGYNEYVTFKNMIRLEMN